MIDWLANASTLVPATAILLLALVSARWLVRAVDIPAHHHFLGVDGLRGFLAVGVVIHHAIFWMSYAKNGSWFFELGRFYYNLGRNSVNLFFMVTGFLFTLKLMAQRETPIDWPKLFVSRVMRLTPLYLVMCLLLFLIIGVNTGFKAQEPVETLWFELRDWLLFTIPGRPDINAFPDTQLPVAGVVWTLPYEWFFYFSLPVLALLFRVLFRFKAHAENAASDIARHVAHHVASNVGWLLLSALCVVSYSAWHLEYNLLFGFVGGAVAAISTTNKNIAAVFQGRGANVVALLCVAISYSALDTVCTPNFLVLTLFMCLVANGATLFGLLATRPVRALSAISYGLYLLHGLVLYVVMIYLVPGHYRFTMTRAEHWLIVLACVPLLVGLSSLAWRFVELPAMRKVSGLTQRLRAPQAGHGDAA